jgi:hypothetical protein
MSFSLTTENGPNIDDFIRNRNDDLLIFRSSYHLIFFYKKEIIFRLLTAPFMVYSFHIASVPGGFNHVNYSRQR